MKKKTTLAIVLSLIMIFSLAITLNAQHSRDNIHNSSHIHSCCTTRTIPCFRLSNPDSFTIIVPEEGIYCFESILMAEVKNQINAHLNVSYSFTKPPSQFPIVYDYDESEVYIYPSSELLLYDRLNSVNEYAMYKPTITIDDALVDMDAVMPYFTCCASPTMSFLFTTIFHTVQFSPPPITCLWINNTHTFQCVNCGTLANQFVRDPGCGTGSNCWF